MFRRMVVILLVCSLAACSSRREVVRPDPGTVVEQVEVGDAIRVLGRNGKTYEMEVTEVAGTYLRGVNRGLGKRYKIPFKQIARMEYREFSAMKTAGAVAGTAYVVGALLVLAMAAAFEDVAEGLACAFSFGYDCED